MRILFFGTPQYALPSLERLADEHQVVGVVARPDRPAGRRRGPVPPPTAEFARERGLYLLQPENPGSREFIAEATGLGAGLFVVIAYGHILKKRLIDLPEHGTLNAHGSLLPRYRGAAPVQRAVLAGETETGVTVQRMVPAMDAGPILLAEKTPIGPEETSGELFDRLSELSAECLSRAVKLVEIGEAEYVEQDESEATPAPKLTREEGRADWTKSAAHLARAARAFNPWPTLYTKLPDGRLLKVLAAREAGGSGRPGEVLAATGEDFVVACGEGALGLVRVQAEGKRPVTAADFLRGSRLAAGDRLG